MLISVYILAIYILLTFKGKKIWVLFRAEIISDSTLAYVIFQALKVILFFMKIWIWKICLGDVKYPKAITFYYNSFQLLY